MPTTVLPSGAADAKPRPGLVASLLETTKPGITRLVTITAGVGFAMGHFAAGATGVPASETAVAAVACLVGTYLTAAGANALNQFIERMRDSRMNRTSRRPLPQDRVTPGAVFAFGMVSTVLGVAVLMALGGGWPAAATALACTLVYTLAYTPLKTRSAWSTYVGTIPGALPPVIGWVAAWPGDPALRFGHWGAWSLFVLMTVWQLPHSFALAWMYKDDYAKGGFRLLPVIDESGRKTSRTIAGWALLQIPATLLPVWAMPGVLGWPYAVLAVASGLGYLHLSVRLLRTRSVADARKVFFVSIAHLPLLLVAMVVEGALRRYL